VKSQNGKSKKERKKKKGIQSQGSSLIPGHSKTYISNRQGFKESWNTELKRGEMKKERN